MPLQPPADAPLSAGTLLHDRYRLVGVAGRGRFGQIYLARDQKRHEQLCVLKEFAVPAVDAEARQRYWRAFQAAAARLYSLQHPQLPRFQVMIAQGQRFYWVREYIEGQSYAMLLAQRRAIDQGFAAAEVVQFLEQVLPVLSYLHDRGVVHGNLSLDSIICREGDRCPVLIDFGLVPELIVWLQRQCDLLGTSSSTEADTPPKFTPTQPLYPTDDLSALATMAIVLLTGKSPEALGKNWRLANVQPELEQILLQMLMPSNSSQQFISASQVLRSLQTFQTGRSPGSSSLKRGFSQTRILQFAAVGLNLLLFGAIALWLMRPSVPPSTPPIAGTATSRPAASPLTPPQTLPPTAAPRVVPVPTLPPPPPELEPQSTPPLPADIQSRQQQLELDPQFLGRLLAEAMSMQQFSASGDRSAAANALMDKLQTLEPTARRKLGTYRRADYDRWLNQLGETGSTSPLLDRLADSRMAELFPSLKGKDLNPRTFGQIWYAIAEAQLSTALAQKAGSSENR